MGAKVNRYSVMDSDQGSEFFRGLLVSHGVRISIDGKGRYMYDIFEEKHIQLQDHRVVDHPIDGCGGGPRILEDLVPLGEDQIGGYAHGTPLVALRHQREQEEYLET